MDRMNVARALYSRQTYQDSYKTVEDMVTTKYNNTVLTNADTIDDIQVSLTEKYLDRFNYTEKNLKIYNAGVLLSQYQLHNS